MMDIAVKLSLLIFYGAIMFGLGIDWGKKYKPEVTKMNKKRFTDLEKEILKAAHNFTDLKTSVFELIEELLAAREIMESLDYGWENGEWVRGGRNECGYKFSDPLRRTEKEQQ